MDIIKPVLLFIVGLLCLIKGGDVFVDSSVIIAKKFHLPELLIGATVVSIGTTLPEVMVSATGALQGNAAMAYGNAVGSIICNTALISAITIAIAPSVVKRNDLILPTIFFIIASIIYCVISYTTGSFSRLTGIILLLLFIIYMMLQTRNALKGNSQEQEDASNISITKPIIYLILSAAVIAIGATLLVDNGTILATLMGVPASVIAITMVALGTSLPELITAIQSLAKGHGLLSLGNIIGANLFNLVFVCGMAITLSPFNIPTEKVVFGLNSSLIIELPTMLAVMAILLIPAFIKEKLYRWQGILLLIIYACFIVIQFFL